jgi:hypothetical protein
MTQEVSPKFKYSREFTEEIKTVFPNWTELQRLILEGSLLEVGIKLFTEKYNNVRLSSSMQLSLIDSGKIPELREKILFENRVADLLKMWESETGKTVVASGRSILVI